MALTETPVCNFGLKAADFELPATDGKTYKLADIKGAKGTLVMFICNHCPYVQAVVARLVDDAKALQAAGIGVVAISANDVANYPEDSFENMKVFAEENGFTFPYLYDESQAVAKAYDAVCTPDFFGYNADLGLQYRGRIDASGMRPADESAKRELREAMLKIAETGKGPVDQIPSMGCNIKWKAA